MNKSLLKTGKKYELKSNGITVGCAYAITTDDIVGTPSAFTLAGFVTKDGEGGTYECAIHRSTSSTIGQSDFLLGS